MSRLHSRTRSTFFWLICCSAAIYTVHYFSFSWGTHSVCPLKGRIPSREGLLCEDKGKIVEKNTLRESNTRSWWSCTGNMNYESEWHQRTCVFKNICYDKKKKTFQFYRKPGTVKTPVLFEPKLGHIYPGQTATVVNDRIRRNTMIYLCPYYDRIFPCRIRRNTVVYGEEDDRIRSLYTESACDVRFTSYFSVYDRFSSYTVTTLYDRNTGTGITTKYGRIRS